MGSSDNADVGKSLDAIIADRRKEQAKTLSGRTANESGARNTRFREKKAAIADRSVATGRAKRAAAARARRGLALDKKPSALEVEKEVYRQSRKTAASKKASENKATKGRLPPNSSLREKKGKKKTNDQPGAIVGKKIQAKQIDAAIKGMELAGCPVPKGFELHMQLKPVSTNEKRKGKESNANNKSTNNKAGSQKIGGRRKIGGRGRGRNN
jgi:hypothetical protein